MVGGGVWSVYQSSGGGGVEESHLFKKSFELMEGVESRGAWERGRGIHEGYPREDLSLTMG